MLLGAYYNLWYGRPTLPIIGGGIWRVGYTYTPFLGEYNSRDEKVISQHIQWAKEAGIDFWAVNWTDEGCWDDLTLRDYYLCHPESKEMKFCLLYDSIPALNRYRYHVYPSYNLDELYTPTKTKGEKFLDDFEYLANTYFNLPNYLKIEGKPLVVIYNASAFRNSEKYFDQLKINMAKKGIELYLVADAVCWPGVKISKNSLSFLWDNPPRESLKVIFRAWRRLSFKNYEKDLSLSKYFNAITGYNLYHPNRLAGFLKNLNDLYQKYFHYAQKQNLRFFPNIMPGYDDRKMNGWEFPVLERDNGKFYYDFWQISRKYLDPKLPLALITSFNEWHEGAQIEPSKEYGKQYIELTKKLKNI